MRSSSRLTTLSALLLAFAGLAVARCPINTAQFYVGNKAGTPPLDIDCDYDDIQSAIDAVGACPVIINITREHTWTSQHLSIDNRSLVLAGWGDGVTCQSLKNFCPISGCPQTDPGPLVTIDASHTPGSVLHITGNSNVTLRNVAISNGAAPYDGSGGGIYFDGTGTLTLDASTVDNNYAGYGGGINVNGNGGSATLNLQANALVTFNTAQFSGGGIRMEGTSRLFALGANTLIGYNHALGVDPISSDPSGGYGGGVEIIGPARADIASPGLAGLGVIYSNDAIHGGGLSVNAGQNDGANAQARLFSVDAENPVQVSNNFAYADGGAIYLRSYVQALPYESAKATACASSFRLDDNGAPDGAAIYADWDSDAIGDVNGSNVSFNPADACGPEPAADLGAVPCAAGVICNEVARNHAEDSLAQATNGAAILIGNTGELSASQLIVRNNAGGNAMRLIGDPDPDHFPHAGASLANCLLVDNSVGGELIRAQAATSTPLQLDACTIANNSIGAASVVHSEAGVSLTHSLIYQPDRVTLANSGSLDALYVLSTDLSTLPVGATIQQLVDPAFVDAAHGDYHLQVTSPAVDYAGGLGGSDLDGAPRDIDLPTHANAFGPRDIGAYERQSPYACDNAPDYLFCATFEPQ